VILSPSRRRLILAALRALKSGRDVILVAHPQEQAVLIARHLCQVATKNGILIRNLRGADPSLPVIRTRAFGQTAHIDRAVPVEKRALVLIDLSAVWERGCVREVSVRSVLT
jgi:hypothetical protein